MASPADRPTCLLSFALSPPFCLSFIIGMPNRSCILELRANQCLVSNFLCMPMCKCKIAPKKPQSLSCLRRNFRNMLTPFQVVRNSNSKVFGGLNSPNSPLNYLNLTKNMITHIRRQQYKQFKHEDIKQ